MFGAGLLILWPPLAGYGIRDRSASAILSLTGYLRARPDPWLERTLRKALAEFDRELAVILHDRGTPVGPGGLARSAHPHAPQTPPSRLDETWAATAMAPGGGQVLQPGATV